MTFIRNYSFKLVVLFCYVFEVWTVIFLMFYLGMLNSFFFQIRTLTAKIRIKFELRL